MSELRRTVQVIARLRNPQSKQWHPGALLHPVPPPQIRLANLWLRPAQPEVIRHQTPRLAPVPRIRRQRVKSAICLVRISLPNARLSAAVAVLPSGAWLDPITPS